MLKEEAIHGSPYLNGKGYNIILKKLNIIVSYLIIRVVDWFGKINLFLGVFYIKQELPINEQIRAKDVQVIDETGEKKGIMNINDALDLAYDKKWI